MIEISEIVDFPIIGQSVIIRITRGIQDIVDYLHDIIEACLAAAGAGSVVVTNVDTGHVQSDGLAYGVVKSLIGRRWCQDECVAKLRQNVRGYFRARRAR